MDALHRCWRALAIGACLGIGNAPSAAFSADKAEAVASEAVAAALLLPPGDTRDLVLRSVSRNLISFGHPEVGVQAARAMTDGGLAEVPPGRILGPPRYIPLREAMPSGSPCDAGLWTMKGGRKAITPKQREAWALNCLLERDFDWIGLPPVAEVHQVAADLPPGQIKGDLLAWLITDYRDSETLHFVVGEVERTGSRMPQETREYLEKRLSAPAVLYRLGKKDEALAAVRNVNTFRSRAETIRLLVAANDIEPAAVIFEMLSETPPEPGESCDTLFDWTYGLNLTSLGHASAPVPGIGTFLDRLQSSPLFNRICPKGMEAELAVSHLLAAGRLDDAIRLARPEKATPTLLTDALLQAGRAKFRVGDRNTAREYAVEAAGALPPFVPSEPDGAIDRRLEIIQLLAAAGAEAEADSLARRQNPAGLRAVALSAAVAGRAGLRFDDQAPSLDGVTTRTLNETRGVQ